MSSPIRERLLTGMLETVGEMGYDATSVAAVLERTGHSRGTFYEHFANKDACYLEAFDVGVARIEAHAMTAARGKQGWRAQLRAGLDATLAFLDAEPDIGRALVVEVHAAGPEAAKRRAAAIGEATTFIALAQREPESQSSPGIAAQGVVSGIHSMVYRQLSTESKEGCRSLLPEFMYFAVLPYFGAEVAATELRAVA